MPYEMRCRVKTIYKHSFTQLCAFSFIFIIFTVGLLSVCNVVVGNSQGMVRLLLVLTSSFICEIALAPIITGAYKWVHGLHMGEIRPMKTAFSDFSDLVSIYDAQKTVLSLLFCSRIALTPILLALIVVPLSDVSHTDIFFIIVAVTVSFRLLCSLFPLLHILLNAPHIPLFKAVKLSFNCMRKRSGEFFRLMLIYLFLVAISLASFGVIFVFTIPYIFCSMAVYCDAVFEEHQLYKHNLFY
ncbi:MAG: hypothetical protein E7588_07730 [Ruminococcaceae bacterium]|nr:hypothetical protein [Oscillospiraceae bacterium]